MALSAAMENLMRMSDPRYGGRDATPAGMAASAYGLGSSIGQTTYATKQLDIERQLAEERIAEANKQRKEAAALSLLNSGYTIPGGGESEAYKALTGYAFERPFAPAAGGGTAGDGGGVNASSVAAALELKKHYPSINPLIIGGLISGRGVPTGEVYGMNSGMYGVPKYSGGIKTPGKNVLSSPGAATTFPSADLLTQNAAVPAKLTAAESLSNYLNQLKMKTY